MSYLEAIIFGIVQGVTEFLPISSSAHLVVAGHLLGLPFPGLSFEIFLHQASMLAVVLYFWRELFELVSGFVRFLFVRREEDRKHFFFGIYIAVATVITAVLGILLADFLDEKLRSPMVISVSLVVTGLFLVFIERFRAYGNLTEETMKFRHSVFVGLAQAVAVIPGISRSGSTLVGSLWCGLNQETAVRYSFLLAIPVILGSSVLAIPDLTGEAFAELGGAGPMAVAFVVTFVSSVLGILWLIDFLKKSRLIYFAIYCFIFAIFVFLFVDAAALMEI